MRRLIKSLANKVPVAATAVDFLLYKAGNDPASPESAGEELLERVGREGFATIEGYFTPEQCDQCIRDLEWMVANKPEHVQRQSDTRIFGAEELSPAIDHFHGDPFLLRLANRYIGRKTVNAFTLANKVEARACSLGSGEGWHKDDSFRQVKAFMYLNDVTEENGPFQLVSRSHGVRDYMADMRAGGLLFRHLRISDVQMQRILQRDPSRLRTITGKRGTLIFADTASIHRGKPPEAGVRYALTNYYMDKRHLVEGTADVFRPVSREKVMGMWRAFQAG